MRHRILIPVAFPSPLGERERVRGKFQMCLARILSTTIGYQIGRKSYEKMGDYRFDIGNAIIFLLRVLRDIEPNKDPMSKMRRFL